MEVVEVLEKHRDLLNDLTNEKGLEIIKCVISSEIDSTILDSALEFMLLYAKKCRFEDDLEDFRLISNFLMLEQNQKKEYFLELLQTFNSLILSSTDITNFKKINLVVRIIMSSLYLKNEYQVIKEILNSDIHYTSYDFLLILLQDKTLDSDRLVMIINIVLHSKIDYQRNLEELNYILFILSNEIIRGLDDDNYEKVVKICFNNAKWYLIYKLLVSLLPINYKKIALNYYLEILVSYKGKIDIFNNKELESCFFIDAFMIVYNDALTSFDESSYNSILDDILNSDNPLLMATLKNHNLPIPKEKIAFDINKNNNKYLELASTSLLLNKLNLFDYQEALNIVAALVSKLKSSKDEREKELIITKLDSLIRLFNIEQYNNHIFRLGYIISIILNSDNLFQVNELISFASHENSFYYSDLEFKRAVEILSDCSDIHKVHRIYASKYFLYANLFTNENIPFMDRNSLMDIALEESYQNLLTLTHELNRIGIQNKNMMYLLGDAFNVPKMDIKRVRELILPK